jgi:hypothetical protein
MRRAVHRAIKAGEPRPLGMLVKQADGQTVAVLPVSTHVGATAADRKSMAGQFAKHTTFEIHAEEPPLTRRLKPIKTVPSRGLVTTAPVGENARFMYPAGALRSDPIVAEQDWDAANAARNTELRAGGRRGKPSP